MLIRGHHLVRFGYAYLKSRYEKEAENIFNKLVANDETYFKIGNQPSITHYILASACAVEGDKVRVYEILKRYKEAQKISDFYINYIKYDPWFDSIRDEPEFQKIVGELESKFQIEHERIRKWLEDNNQ